MRLLGCLESSGDHPPARQTAKDTPGKARQQWTVRVFRRPFEWAMECLVHNAITVPQLGRGRGHGRGRGEGGCPLNCNGSETTKVHREYRPLSPVKELRQVICMFSRVGITMRIPDCVDGFRSAGMFHLICISI